MTVDSDGSTLTATISFTDHVPIDASIGFYKTLSWAFDVQLISQSDKASFRIEALNNGTGWGRSVIHVGQEGRPLPVAVSDYGSDLSQGVRIVVPLSDLPKLSTSFRWNANSKDVAVIPVGETVSAMNNGPGETVTALNNCPAQGSATFPS